MLQSVDAVAQFPQWIDGRQILARSHAGRQEECDRSEQKRSHECRLGVEIEVPGAQLGRTFGVGCIGLAG
jgi:hypothetical protein